MGRKVQARRSRRVRGYGVEGRDRGGSGRRWRVPAAQSVDGPGRAVRDASRREEDGKESMKEQGRCGWAKGDNYVIYHDTEWGVPLHDDGGLFEFLILEGAQAGLSWSTILNKRENYRRAFDGFDPQRIAKYQPKKIETLLADAGIVRNKLKIAAAIENAKAFLRVQGEFGSFDRYI